MIDNLPRRQMGPAKLLERGQALDAVQQSLEQARSGTGNALFVLGEAGLGKTSVLEAARRAAAGRLHLAAARGEAMEELLPFGVIEQLMEALGEADALWPDRASAESQAPHYRVLRALRSPQQPLLVTIDDLQLADPDSLGVIAFLARRLAGLPVALIASLRPWPPEAERLLRGLVARGFARVERLKPLSRQATEALLAARAGGRVSPASTAGAWELCGGNPLLLHQVGEALARGERLPPAGRASELGKTLLLWRFAGLDSQGVQCARAASILGDRFRSELPAAIAGADDLRAEESLVRSGVLVEEGDGTLRFAHPLFGQALYEDLGHALRRRLHARAFEILVERGLHAEAVEHAIRAELTGDPRAVAIVHDAGRAALERGAVATASTQLEAAAKLAGAKPSSDLLRDLCQALAACGRTGEAAEFGHKLLADSSLSWQERLDALCTYGRCQYLLGAADRGEGSLAQAASLAIEHGAPELAVDPLLDQSQSAWATGGPARALPLARRARELARAGCQPLLRLRADAVWGRLAAETGDVSAAAAMAPVVELLTDGRLALDAGELAWPWATIYHAVAYLSDAERYGEVERILARARKAMSEAGAPTALARLARDIAINELRRGRIEGALAEAEIAREFAELAPRVLAYADVVQAEALAWSGRADESENLLTAAEEIAAGEWSVRLWVAHVRGMRLLWENSPEAAAQFRLAEELTLAAGIGEPSQTPWQAHALAAHVAAGQLEDARRVIAWLERGESELPRRWPRIAAALGRALVADAEGESEIAEDRFRAALALHRQAELPLQRVEALLAYGSFLRRAGQSVRSRSPLADALQTAESLGAVVLADEARRELSLARGRRRRRDADREELTAAERRVADLAAEGLSNAEIARALYLSVNTVQTHLKHIYAKLGIRSRRELMIRRTG